jgi:hypothetical protein
LELDQLGSTAAVLADESRQNLLELEPWPQLAAEERERDQRRLGAPAAGNVKPAIGELSEVHPEDDLSRVERNRSVVRHPTGYGRDGHCSNEQMLRAGCS